MKHIEEFGPMKYVLMNLELYYNSICIICAEQYKSYKPKRHKPLCLLALVLFYS